MKSLISFAIIILAQLSLKAQKTDSIIKGKGFLVFRNDTLNRVNELGEKYGKWIELDSSQILTSSVKISCYFGEERKCISDLKFDTVYICNIKKIGLYKDGVKDSIWNKYGTNEILVSQMAYSNGEIRYFKGLKPNGEIEIYATLLANGNGDEANFVLYGDDSVELRRGKTSFSFLDTVYY
jgi:hypothetical protein